MAKINIGSSYVEVPSSLDPAAPQDLRGARPSTSAFDAEVTQRAQAMAQQRRNAPGGMNATAGSTPPTQAPNGAPGVAGQQMGAANSGPVDGRGRGLLGRTQSAVRSAVGAGQSPGIGSAFKSVGEGVASGVGKAARTAVKFGGVPLAGIFGAADGLRTDTDQYARRFGLEDTEPGVLRDIGVRALGVGSDVVNNALFGAPKTLGWFRDKPGDPASTLTQAMQEVRPGLVSGDNMATGKPAVSAVQPTANPNAFTPGQTTRGLRDMPGASGETMKGQFGNFSPAGTFTDGFTDLGQGIAGKSNRADGKMNDFTNIGADGKPTALSGVDTRSPDQIANGNRINAETAKVVAAAGGSANLTRNNALMAANLRDGVDPMRGIDSGPSVSIMGNSSGMGGGRRNKFDDGSGMVTPVTGRGLREQQKIAQDAANAERANLATLRGQDMNLQGHLLPKQMEMEMAQRMRALQGQLWQQSGGDPRKAQELALQMGIDGKAFGELADADQKRSDAGRAQTKDLLAPLSVVQNEKGEDVISPAKQAQREALVRQMLPQFEAGTPDQKALDLRQLAPAVNVVDAGNARRSNSFWQQLPSWMPGAEAATPEASTPPDFAPGYLDTVDGTEGLLKGGGVSKGDYRAKVKNGPDVYLDRSKIGVAELELLKSRGVTLRGAN